MSKQRLDLLNTSRRDEVQLTPAEMQAVAHGERPLAEALGLTHEDVSGLRAQAQALFDTGKHERAAAVFEALVALERWEPEDLVQLAACYDGLGNRPLAEHWSHVATDALRHLDALVAEARLTGDRS